MSPPRGGRWFAGLQEGPETREDQLTGKENSLYLQPHYFYPLVAHGPERHAAGKGGALWRGWIAVRGQGHAELEKFRNHRAGNGARGEHRLHGVRSAMDQTSPGGPRTGTASGKSARGLQGSDVWPLS